MCRVTVPRPSARTPIIVEHFIFLFVIYPRPLTCEVYSAHEISDMTWSGQASTAQCTSVIIKKKKHVFYCCKIEKWYCNNVTTEEAITSV